MTEQHWEQPTETAAPRAGEHAPEANRQSPGFRMIAPHGPVDDSFADGVTGFVVGRNVIKLDLYRVAGYDRETGQEVRTQSHRVVLPLTAINELRDLLGQLEKSLQGNS